jgi:catechol 2,3-dioxygenase-like lactoylglutathione lyase family enzyme
MPAERLEHYTIRCANLERTRDFYRDMLGLTVGDRPPFNFKGYWLYLAGTPIVHLVEQSSASRDTGALDHIAFSATDIDGMRAVLSKSGHQLREAGVPGGKIRQLFVSDPDGILVELNFRT